MTAAEALRKIAKTTDALLVDAWWKIAKAEDVVRSYVKIQGGAAKHDRPFRFTAKLATAQEELANAKAEAAPLEAIAAAGNWTRFVLVPGGHLHKGFGCSTLRWTTQTGLMPEYSGADEVEIVELAGEAACTVCFPSAPVAKKSMLPIHVAEREARAQEAAEKAAKREAAKAAEIVVGRKVYKSQRGAENQIGWEIDTYVGRRFMVARDEAHRAHLDDLAAKDLAAAHEIAEAIAAAVDGYSVEAILERKFAAKVKEHRKYPHYKIPADASL